MAAPVHSDELWSVIAPLLPAHLPRPRDGRPPVPDRACLTSILFELNTGIPCEYLPQEMGCGSGMTCWRRLRDWHRAGVWDVLQATLLARLQAPDYFDWDRAVMDASIVRVKGGIHCRRGDGPQPDLPRPPGDEAPCPHRRAGPPARAAADAGQSERDHFFGQLLDAVPPVRGRVGRPRQRPGKLHADQAYHFPCAREALRARNIQPRIARCRVDLSATLGRHRWFSRSVAAS